MTKLFMNFGKDINRKNSNKKSCKEKIKERKHQGGVVPKINTPAVRQPE